jgi:hypothetical protein
MWLSEHTIKPHCEKILESLQMPSLFFLKVVVVAEKINHAKITI